MDDDLIRHEAGILIAELGDAVRRLRRLLEQCDPDYEDVPVDHLGFDRDELGEDPEEDND